MKELEMTEGRGTGIPKMLKALKNNESPMPVFHTDKYRTSLTIEFPIHPAFLEKGTTGDGQDREVVEKVVEKVVEGLSSNQRGIVEAIAKNPTISAQGLAELIGISHRKTQDNLAKLKNMGVLKRIGPDKGGHWEVSRA